jgi:2-C-methyl-D-erythritol 4-phosphate cytidylyltransferase
MLKMKKIVIIVAGGTGTRMKSTVPKQFMLLKNRPILMHTIERFYQYDPEIEIRLVLPSSEFASWEELSKEYSFTLKHTLFAGGEHRFHSVKNGLKDISNPALIAIHDGVRPLVNIKTISDCFDLAEKSGVAIPVLEIKESIRQITSDGSECVPRQFFKSVQTPQVFQSEILLKAYNTQYKESFTDDASVVESSGYKVYLTDGNEENIKITSRQDLRIAEILFE